MPSRRMIDPAFWQSETVAALPINVRYFFIGLFSNADDQGRMKAHPALIRSKLYPYDDIPLTDIEEMLGALAADDFIIEYSVDSRNYLQIKNWWTYQRPHWAWPSDHPAPEGWADRVCYRKGNTPIKENWGGDDTGPQDESGDSGATVEPERGQSGATVESAPSTRVRGSTSTRVSGSEESSLAADAAPPPQPDPPEPTPKPKTKAAPKRAPPLTDGQRGFLDKHGAKRFKNGEQRTAVLALEQQHGTAVLLEGSSWTAKKGMTLGNAIISLESALPNWGKPKPKGNSGSRASPAKPEPKGYAGIRQWMEEEGDEWPNAEP